MTRVPTQHDGRLEERTDARILLFLLPRPSSCQVAGIASLSWNSWVQETCSARFGGNYTGKVTGLSDFIQGDACSHEKESVVRTMTAPATAHPPRTQRHSVYLLVLWVLLFPHDAIAFVTTTRRRLDSSSRTTQSRPSNPPPLISATMTRSTTRSQPQSPQPCASALLGCSVTVIDPETGVEVILLGCFHGSQSSADDVTTTLTQASSSSLSSSSMVVALELCASRFADLRRHRVHTNTKEDTAPASTAGHPQRPWIQRYTKMVATTARTQGVPAAIAAALLSGVSGVQTGLAGNVPGLEFTTAANYCEEYNVDIVLADQSVDVTLERLGDLPNISWGMWKRFVSSGGAAWEETFGEPSAALQLALAGRTSKSVQDDAYSNTNNELVSLASFLTRSDAAVKDLLRLTLAPLCALQAVNLAANVAVSRSVGLLSAAHAAEVAASSTTILSADAAGGGTILMDLVSLATVVLPNAVFLGFVYMSVALPATRAVLIERDDVLVNGIRAACRLAASKTTDTENSSRGVVVAVLGLLHVNGVAQRIEESR